MESYNNLQFTNGEFVDAKIRHKLDQVKSKVEQKNQNALKILFKSKSIFDFESSIIGSLIYVSLRKKISALSKLSVTDDDTKLTLTPKPPTNPTFNRSPPDN